MMTSAACLPRETLKQYLVGDVEESESAVIEAHLATCESCEQTVVELEANPETLLVGMPGPDKESLIENSQSEPPSIVKHAMDAARRMAAPPEKQPIQWPVGQIGAYELLRPLGRGGMGMVVLAKHRSLQKEVAIKLLSSLVGDRPELVTRFQREIRAAGRLQHPSIVNATDAGQEHGTHYLVMEYIAGLDLSRIARLTGRLAIADACELMRQAALGLSHAHAEGIVHRDVKPSNLMLDASGHVKILDFGLAQINLWEEPVCELTTVGQLMGTIDYMAPEQAERTGAVDYRADLYALGATLFRLLAGRAPLAAAPNMTLLEKVRLLGSQTSPLLSSVREDCPATLVQLVSQLLSRDPAARPASAAHVAEALQPFCEGAQLAALLESAQAAAVAEPDAAAVDPALLPQSVLNSAGLKPSALQFAESKSVSQLPTKPPSRRGWAVAAAMLPLLIFGGFLITIETQKGQLVIQSEVAGVHIQVAKDGKIVDEFSVQPGAKSTRLRADKYEILIDAPSDEVVIDKQEFSIKNGETVVATIKQVHRSSWTANGLSNAGQSNGGPATWLAPVELDEPTYKLVGYKEWLRILAVDTSDEKQIEALNAIRAISSKHSIIDARPVIIDVLRSISNVSQGQTVLSIEAFSVLKATYPDLPKYFQFIADELSTGDARWQVFLVNSMAGSTDAIAFPAVTQEIIRLMQFTDEEHADVVDAAINCLCDYLVRTQGSGDQNANSIREIAGALAQANRPADFWYQWIEQAKWQNDSVLADLIAAAATRVVNEELSTSDQMLSAMRVLSLYSKPLANTEWMDRYCTTLLNDPKRLETIYEVTGRKSGTSANSRGAYEPHENFEEMLQYNACHFEFRQKKFVIYFSQAQNNAKQIPCVQEAIELLNVISKHQLVAQKAPLLRQLQNKVAVDEQFPQFQLTYDVTTDVYYSRLSKRNTDLTTAQIGSELVASATTFLLTQNAAKGEGANSDPTDAASKTDAMVQAAGKGKELATADPAASPPATIPIDPFFDGRTLSQWMEILERDRDQGARSTAIKAIQTLTLKEDAQKIAERTVAIARKAEVGQWSDYGKLVDIAKFGGQPASPSSLDTALISALKQLNGDEWFQKFLTTELLVGDDIWTARWLAALLKTRSTKQEKATIYQYYHDKDRFESLGPNSAWLAFAWLQIHLLDNAELEEAEVAKVIKLIEDQPHLGRLAVLQMDAIIQYRFNQSSSSIVGANGIPVPMRAQLVLEETIAEYAKSVLLDDAASPEAVARAASRLASTTEKLEVWKPEMVEVIRKRLKALAADPKRLLAFLPTDPKITRPPMPYVNNRFVPIPVVNRFETSPGEDIPQMRLRQAMSLYLRMGAVPPYIEFEALALIALLVRLDAAECEDALVAVYDQTRDAFDVRLAKLGTQELRSTPSGWPVLREANDDPTVSPEIQLGWMIHRTVFAFAKEIGQLPRLADVYERADWKQQFVQLDVDLDGKLPVDQLPKGSIEKNVDANADGSMDFDEYVVAMKQLKELAAEQEKLNGQNQARPEDNAALEWAERQISKYDRDGDGRLSAEECKQMLVKPAEGADTDGDGFITATEYANRRKTQTR